MSGALRAELLDRNLRVALRLGVSRQRVSISFDVFAEEDGGATWTVSALVPARDRRRADERIVGTGDDLDAAEAALYRRASAQVPS